MDGFQGIGRLIMFLGFGLVLVGALFWLLGKLPGIGRLPGDIVWRRGNFTVYVPLATSILLSLILTLILNMLFRRR